MTITTPSRLDRHHIEHHTRRAIAARLHYPVREVKRDGASVIVRVNSGGDALEGQSYLRSRGYTAEDADANPDGYGCAVRVTLKKHEQECASPRSVET